MSTRTVICPECRSAAQCRPANFIRVSVKDVPAIEKIKHVSLREEKGYSSWRPYYHAVHYPGIDPALENVSGLPEKYSADKWYSGFADLRSKEKTESVVRCDFCGYLNRLELEWPNDAFFKIEYKGKLLWAYDRKMAMKILNYIESSGRKKRLFGTNKYGETDDDYIVQDYELRKLPEIFQTAKARPEISKKLRKVLGLPTANC